MANPEEVDSRSGEGDLPIDVDRLAVAIVDALQERELLVPMDTRLDNGLATPKQLAAEEGVTRATVHNRITDWGLVRRNEEGYPKDHEGGSTYVSRPAWRAREALPTSTVRRLAGLAG